MEQRQRLSGLRLNILFGFMNLIGRLGLHPTAAKIAAQPIKQRKANRAAGWTTYPAPPDVATTYGTIAARSGPIARAHRAAIRSRC